MKSKIKLVVSIIFILVQSSCTKISTNEEPKPVLTEYTLDFSQFTQTFSVVRDGNSETMYFYKSKSNASYDSISSLTISDNKIVRIASQHGNVTYTFKDSLLVKVERSYNYTEEFTYDSVGRIKRMISYTYPDSMYNTYLNWSYSTDSLFTIESGVISSVGSGEFRPMYGKLNKVRNPIKKLDPSAYCFIKDGFMLDVILALSRDEVKFFNDTAYDTATVNWTISYTKDKYGNLTRVTRVPDHKPDDQPDFDYIFTYALLPKQ